MSTKVEKKISVKTFLRKGKRVKAFRRRQKVKSERDTKKVLINTGISLVGAAAVIGVGTLAYKQQIKRYRAGFAKSAEQSINIAKSINVGKVKAKQTHIIFGVGGLSKSIEQQSGETVALTSKRFFSNVKRGEDFKLVPVSSTASNPHVLSGKDLDFFEANVQYYKNILKKGRNPTAVDLAANVIAYGDKFPDKTLVMLGHSSGGFAVHEAQEIIRIARPDFEPRLKSVTFGSENWGATRKFGESVTLGSKNDPITKYLPTRDLHRIDSVKSHFFYDYSSNPEVQEFLKKYLYNTDNKSNFYMSNVGLLEFVKNSPKKRKRTAAEKAAISQGLREYYATQPKKVETKLDKLDKSSKSILRLSRAGANLMSTAALGLSLAGKLKAMTYKPSRGERVFQNVSAGAGLLSTVSGAYRGFGTGTRSLASSANIYDDLRIGAKAQKRNYQYETLGVKREVNRTKRQSQAAKIRIERERNKLKKEELGIKHGTAASYGLIASTSAKSNSRGGTKLEDARTRRARLTSEQMTNLSNW